MARQHQKVRGTDWVRLIAPLALIGALLFLAWKFGYFAIGNPRTLNRTAGRVAGTPWLGPLFVAVYAVSAAMAVPIAPLAYAAGAVFGFAKGSIDVWIASLIGGSAGYWLARGVWRDPARRLLGRYEKKLNALRQGHAFLTTLRMQLLPIVPFGVFNYAAAITDLPFLPFLLATALGIVPGTFAAVFVGHEVMAGMRGNDKRPIWIGTGVALTLIAFSFIPALVRKMRR